MSLNIFDNGRIDFDVAQKDGLRTAVIISLLTDRRAAPDDAIPNARPGSSVVPPDRRGWCGDTLGNGQKIGSRLWLLKREKQTEETRRRAVAYCREALQWMLDEGIAANVAVDAQWARPEWLEAQILITLPDGSDLALQFNNLTGEAYAI